MSVIIRSMTASDAPIIKEMMRVFYASPAVLSNGSDEIFAADVENCVNDSPYLEGFVFEDAGQILGYSMVAKSFSTEFGKPCIWIEDLYLNEDCRGKGYGKAMIEHIFACYPHCIFRLEAEEENERAIGLYRKCGFEVLPYLEQCRAGRVIFNHYQQKKEEHIERLSAPGRFPFPVAMAHDGESVTV